MRRHPSADGIAARVIGLVATVALGWQGWHGVTGSLERGDRGTIEAARADDAWQRCLEAELRRVVPPGSKLHAPDGPTFWTRQRLVEWASPDIDLVDEESAADYSVRIALDGGACRGRRIQLDRVAP